MSFALVFTRKFIFSFTFSVKVTLSNTYTGLPGRRSPPSIKNQTPMEGKSFHWCLVPYTWWRSSTFCILSPKQRPWTSLLTSSRLYRNRIIIYDLKIGCLNILLFETTTFGTSHDIKQCSQYLLFIVYHKGRGFCHGPCTNHKLW